MHFWIDKRSQTCGFSGRHRVPSSGFGARHRQRGNGGFGALGLGLCSASTARNYNCHPPQPHVKLMVTPVHRFQSIECVTNNGRRYNPHGGLHHRANSRWQSSSSGLHHHHAPSPSNFNSHPATSRADAHAHATGTSLELERNSSADNFFEITDGVAHPGGTSASHLQDHHNHVILPAAGKLKCGMWASFAIVTVFMVGAKFYFNNQSTGMEVLIFCSLLVVVLFAGCTVSLCEAVTSAPSQPLTSPIIIDSTANRLSPQQAHNNRASSENLDEQSAQHLHPLISNPPSAVQLNNNQPTTIEPQPPPPYHIAVLLPQHQPSNNNNQQHHIIIVDDSPPPSYDKVVIS